MFLTFVGRDTAATFENEISFGGTCDSLRIEEPIIPTLRDWKFSWSVEFGRSPVLMYMEHKRNRGHSIPDGTQFYERYWADASASIFVVDTEWVHINLRWPGADFTTFMMGNVTGGMVIRVSQLAFEFATKPDAPAPTAEAFLQNGAAAFCDRTPRFSLHSPQKRTDK